MNYLLLALSLCIAVLQNSVCSWCGKNRLRGMSDMLRFQSVAFLMAFVLLLAAGPDFVTVSLYTCLLGAGFGGVTALVYLFTLLAMAVGPMSLTSLIISLAMIIPTLAGAAFWGEAISAGQWTGLGFMVIAFVLCRSVEAGKDGKSRSQEVERGDTLGGKEQSSTQGKKEQSVIQEGKEQSCTQRKKEQSVIRGEKEQSRTKGKKEQSVIQGKKVLPGRKVKWEQAVKEDGLHQDSAVERQEPDKKTVLVPEIVSGRWILYCTAAFLGSGLVGILQKVHQTSVYKEEAGAFLLVAFGTADILFFAAGFLAGGKRKPGFGYVSWISGAGLCMGICIALCNKLNLYLAGVMPSAVFYPLVNGGGILLTCLVAVLIFHERLTGLQKLGIGIGLAAVVLIGTG